MDGKSHPALLPAGLVDLLPPEAEFEASVMDGLMAAFARYGYERVTPPLIEFEDSLLGGTGAALAPQTFRVMDPVSQRMLGVRPDMTLQIARIAISRLGELPRPLRLSYAGQVLRVKGTPHRPERQFGQVGAELIGSSSSRADAEIVLMAANSLRELGISGLTVDLGLPTLVRALFQHLDLIGKPAAERLQGALDHKDSAALRKIPGIPVDLFEALIGAAGPAEAAVAKLTALKLPRSAERELDELAAVVAAVRAGSPDLRLTFDPVEFRGFEYHTGVTFTLFADQVRGELGAGGRYLAGGQDDLGAAEPATGFTLYVDMLLRALPRPRRPERVFLPADAPAGAAERLRGQGKVVVAALEERQNGLDEARRLGCSHILADGALKPLAAVSSAKSRS
jgi:ATP phosphoribosyltransferase regulatory subunit